jgi:alpha-mannosidase
VQHDEALTNYETQINQMTDGHQFLKNEFNYTINTGWQIDTFGFKLF